MVTGEKPHAFKRILTAVLIAAFLSFAAAYAEVKTTEAPTDEDAIYIAGNPDLYPIEYYDAESSCYEGILPEIYKSISRKTGVDFTYVSAGKENQQKRLSDNLQVEMISAYEKDEVKPETEIKVFEIAESGKKREICVGFTEIMPEETAERIEKLLLEAGKNEIISSAMNLKEPETSDVKYLLGFFLAASITALIAILHAMKKQKQHREDEKKLAMSDEMTMIGNKEYFEYAFNKYVKDEVRELYYIAYFAFDADNVERYFGVKREEDIQKHVAKVLSTAVNESDFAARIENGVFALAFMAASDEQAEIHVCTLLDEINNYEYILLGENNAPFRAGIYSVENSRIPVEIMLYNAQQGQLYASLKNRNVSFCTTEILEGEKKHQRLQKKLQSALENDEFVMYMQFIVRTDSFRIVGAEVLSRWNDREDGLLLPGSYIEELKHIGLSAKLDFMLLEKCCSKLEEWNETPYSHLRLSCNFTRLTVSSENFFSTFCLIVDKYKFDRKNLIIELTEDTLADDGEYAAQNIIACKSKGCMIALDDFGSGFSSLHDLIDYPIDIIKIDRMFIKKIVERDRGGILQGICNLAHSMGIEVLCEGVEDEKDEKVAVEGGCEYIQGYAYSHALPEENAMRYYEKYMAALQKSGLADE